MLCHLLRIVLFSSYYGLGYVLQKNTFGVIWSRCLLSHVDVSFAENTKNSLLVLMWWLSAVCYICIVHMLWLRCSAVENIPPVVLTDEEICLEVVERSDS